MLGVQQGLASKKTTHVAKTATKKQHCCFVCENCNDCLVFYVFKIEKRALSKMVMDFHNIMDFAKTKSVYLSKKNLDPGTP